MRIYQNYRPWMTLKSEFSRNFALFRTFWRQQQLNEWR